LQQHPLLFTTNRTDRTFFVWRLPWHDLHILVTAPFCCDRKSLAACAQSFAPWQQATIEITRRDHSIIACSRHIYVWCCSSRTSRSLWITHLTQRHRRGCNTTTGIRVGLPICHFAVVFQKRNVRTLCDDDVCLSAETKSTDKTHIFCFECLRCISYKKMTYWSYKKQFGKYIQSPARLPEIRSFSWSVLLSGVSRRQQPYEEYLRIFSNLSFARSTPRPGQERFEM